MPRCPFLGLEEDGTAPFPFTSPSHRCYTSAEGLPIGQQEQERYCLAKKYTSCPLFLSQSFQGGLADRLPGARTGEEKPQVVAEPPLKDTVEPLSIREILADRFARAVAEEEKREAVVEPPLKDTVEPPPTREASAEEPLEAVAQEEKPEVTAESPLKDTAEPLSIREILADRFTGAVAEEEKREAMVEPPLNDAVEPPPPQQVLADKPPEAVAEEQKPEAVAEPPLKGIVKAIPEAMPMVFKGLPWIAGGMAVLVLFCVGGAVTFRVLSNPPEISPPSVGLPSLLPGALLLVSAISFIGAVLLISLFLWIRRAPTRR
jgi:hypothetical protein